MQSASLIPHEQIQAIILGYWQARSLALATSLGVADHLADGPLTVDELASRTQTNASALFRLLRALESIGIFSQSSPQVFVNTPTSDCLRRDVPGAQWPTVLHNLGRGYGPVEGWDELEYSVRTGKRSIDKTYGYDFWELCRRNPQVNVAVNETMRSLSEAMTPVITAAYDWSKFPVIEDVGGGIGTQIVSILDANPSCRGILFDQPHVVAGAIVHDRLKTLSGSFFEAVPDGADATLMRWVLHDWSDTEATEILKTVRRSMKPSARLILVEFVLSDGAGFDFGKWTDLQMLVMFGGLERTKLEYRDLLVAAGFELEEEISTPTPVNLLIARPV
ncbi:methyltransferase [Granulicella sp. WH15]|uniref:methyltransferase n=1 Tax=Granulicella sp. WH15 TaxID=2602070 RepID=UPI001366AF3A|nr:methyltransferase [Granulicella sp. WH15]QHN03667.1 methyltransferase [Granulicella sp. WH15]